MIGRNLAHYRILRSLGKGGMGEVFAAEDTRLRREVALKVLPEAVTSNSERILRFEREARAVAALNHPNIVTIHSVEHADGVHFLTMELVEGSSLRDVIPSGGLPVEKIFSVAVPLADALSVAHEKGIVHRDLKPGNVMVTKDGRVKVLDFGLAKLRGEQLAGSGPEDLTEPLTETDQVVGTVPYMSPEQLRGEEVDERSDIFSLGLILHEMVTGKRAFSGVKAEVISSILRDKPEPLATVRPELPHHLGRIVSLCLVKDPDRRYQSARDVRNELEVLQKEVAKGELRPSTLSGELPTVRAPRRGWRWAALVAAGILGAALLVALVNFLMTRGPTAEAEIGSVAVLPLANSTGDADQDYLGEGISAGLITQLGELSGLRVVGRSEARELRGDEVDAMEVGRRLGVQAVLEGELQRTGTALRVSLKLTDALSGEALWSKAVAGGRERLFELQYDLARDLIRYLSIPVSRAERRRLARPPTESRRAYEHYLQGQLYLAAVEDPRNARFAVAVFEQAVRLDAEFALAHVGLSEAAWQAYELGKDPAMLERAERAAERALEIDPELPSAQVALARVYRQTGRYAVSISEVRSILEHHPRPDEAYKELAFGYEQVGELEAAERALEAAVALRPDHWHNWNSLGGLLLRQGRTAEARSAFEKAAERSPEAITWPLENLVAIQMRQGDFAAAIEAYSRFGEEVTSARLASNIGTAYFFTGDAEGAERLYRLAVRLAPDDAGQHGNLGDALVRLGRTEEAREEYAAAHRLIDETLERFPDNHQLRLQGALYAAKAGQCEEAGATATRLEVELPAIAQTTHFLAWIYGICDLRDEALAAIRSAIELGIAPELIRREDEFSSLRDEPEFRRLVGAASGGDSD